MGGGDEAWIGRVLGGRYRIVRALGRGGMGAVYEAHQEGLGRRVALKILHPYLAQDAQLVARFRREAESAAGLGHPNIVQVTDFGREEDGTVFLVMELLDGVPLASLVEGDRIEVDRIAKIAWQVLSALDAAHRAGIVHRDLKPDNIFVTSVSGVGDVVKLLDFGIAKLAESEGAGLTATGTVMGTPAYMAPEQARGAPVDARVDVYALGVVMYEALSGRLPYGGNNYNQLIAAILTEQPPPIRQLRPDLPTDLLAVVERAMSRDPAGRFADASSMRDALAPFVEPRARVLPPTRAHPAQDLGNAPTIASTPGVAHRAPRSTPPPVARPGGRSGPWILVSVILAAVAGGALVFAFTRGGDSPAPAVSSEPPLAMTAIDEPASGGPSAPARGDGGRAAEVPAVPEGQESPASAEGSDAPAAPDEASEAETPTDPAAARRARAKRAAERAAAERAMRRRRMRIYASSASSNNLYPVSEMRAKVNTQLGGVERCYRGREVKNGWWALEIDERGRVTRAYQPGTAMDEPQIIECVAQALSRIELGPPTRAGEVRIGFGYRRAD